MFVIFTSLNTFLVLYFPQLKVLTFLDSHIEATEGWLEPLLERVHQNPKAIACPVIEEVTLSPYPSFTYLLFVTDTTDMSV